MEENLITTVQVLNGNKYKINTVKNAIKFKAVFLCRHAHADFAIVLLN